jgi:hypothetical protein
VVKAVVVEAKGMKVVVEEEEEEEEEELVLKNFLKK